MISVSLREDRIDSRPGLDVRLQGARMHSVREET